jgi:hypothetical protein
MDSDLRAILADVRTERTTVNELDRNLTSAYLKARLSEASGLLDDVEGWLGTRTEQRITVDSARWRDFVDGIIAGTTERRT